MNSIVFFAKLLLGVSVAHAQSTLPPQFTMPKLGNMLCPDSTKVCAFDSLPDFINMILKFIVDAGTPIVAIAFIWTGLKYVLAQGNPGKLTEAHRTAKYTLIGAALILGSFVITKVITATVGDIIN